MKKVFGCFLFAFCMLTASSQYVYLETGKVLFFFNYKNSEGESLSNLSGSNENNYGLGLRMSLFKTAWHLSIGGAYNKYGAESNDQALGIYNVWDLAYLGAHLGVDYEFFKPSGNLNEQVGFSFYIRGIFWADFLINGTQKLNNQIFELAGVEEFDKPIYFLKGGVGGNYYISRAFIIHANYMFGRSILFGNYTDQEQLRFITHSVSVGLSFNLFYNQ